jgi:acylphosphatase
MPSVSVIVMGKVQGVGFRSFVVRTARDLEIVGEVWNRNDGSVELIAVHESIETLGAFVERLRSGPGYVARIFSAQGPDNLSAHKFEISFTR